MGFVPTISAYRQCRPNHPHISHQISKTLIYLIFEVSFLRIGDPAIQSQRFHLPIYVRINILHHLKLVLHCQRLSKGCNPRGTLTKGTWSKGTLAKEPWPKGTLTKGTSVQRNLGPKEPWQKEPWSKGTLAKGTLVQRNLGQRNLGLKEPWQITKYLELFVLKNSQIFSPNIVQIRSPGIIFLDFALGYKG